MRMGMRTHPLRPAKGASMGDESIGQRKRNAILGTALLAIALVASAASILPLAHITSVGQIGAAFVHVEQTFLTKTALAGPIHWSHRVHFADGSAGGLPIAFGSGHSRVTSRIWRICEVALGLPVVAALPPRELGAEVVLLESKRISGTSSAIGPTPVWTLGCDARLIRHARSWSIFGLQGPSPEP